MVRDVFRLARENSPSVVFIDEIDAIATKRFDAQTGADREVQRILLELLNQMDGFDQSTNVKVGGTAVRMMRHDIRYDVACHAPPASVRYFDSSTVAVQLASLVTIVCAGFFLQDKGWITGRGGRWLGLGLGLGLDYIS